MRPIAAANAQWYNGLTVPCSYCRRGYYSRPASRKGGQHPIDCGGLLGPLLADKTPAVADLAKWPVD